MGLKELILIVAMVVALSISIPNIIRTNQSIKEIEKYYGKRKETIDKKGREVKK